MERKLRKDLKWTPQELELELLEWETKPADFDRLVTHVVEIVNAEIALKKGIVLSSLASEKELRAEIWNAAKDFEEKYVSLPNHVYLHIKAFLICKMKGEKWR